MAIDLLWGVMRPDPNIAETYARDGFVFPIDVLGAGDALALRADLEDAEAALADDPERLPLLRGRIRIVCYHPLTA